MNMKSYQTFAKRFESLSSNFDDEEIVFMPTMGSIDKTKYYKKAGIKTKEEQEHQEAMRTKYMLKNMKAGLQLAKVFEIDKIEKRLMLLTEAPKDKRILKKVKLPFPAIFLDLDIDSSELDVEVDFKSLSGLLVCSLKADYDDKGWKDEHLGLCEMDDKTRPHQMLYVAYSGIAHTSEYGETFFVDDILIPVEVPDDYKVHYHDKKNLNFLRDFIINFLLFVNNPDIEYVQVNRTDKSNARRMKNKKIPLPDSRRIRLTGKIKRYASTMMSSLTGDGFDFKFWVRGHWRMYQDARYKLAKGRVDWIEPFMKGSGEEKPIAYKIVPKKEDKAEYKERFMFMDDIKPLDKPLQNMNDKERRRKSR
ncbi:MAG: hypothetical protein GY861_17230 [bacterium]|nr:hypothetical protein [bacterium]